MADYSGAPPPVMPWEMAEAQEVWPPPEWGNLYGELEPVDPYGAPLALGPQSPKAAEMWDRSAPTARPNPAPMQPMPDRPAGKRPVPADDALDRMPDTVGAPISVSDALVNMDGGLQPGLGIPAATLDAALVAPPYDPWNVQLAPLDGKPADLGQAIGGFARSDMGRGITSAVNPGALLDEQYASGADGSFDQDEYNKRVAKFAEDHPDEFADWDISNQLKAQSEHNRKIAKANEDAARASRDNLELARKAREEADIKQAAVDRFADEMTADGGYHASRGTGVMIADTLMAVIGGLIQGKTGSDRNMGIELLNQRVGQYIDLQKQKLADKRSRVAQLYQKIGDDFQFNEMLRISALKTAEAEATSELVNRDPRGTQARMLVKYRAGIQAEKAKAMQAVGEREIALATKRLQNAKTAAEIEKMQAEARKAEAEAAAKARAGMGSGAAKASFSVTPEQLKSMEKPPGFPGTQKDWFAFRKQAIESERLANPESAPATAEALVNQTLGGKTTTNEDGTVVVEKYTLKSGKPWIMPATLAPKIQTQLPALKDTVTTLRQIQRLRHEKGMTTRWEGANADYKRHVAKLAINLAAAKGLSVSDKQSVELIVESALGVDPSSMTVGDLQRRIDDEVAAQKKSFVNTAIAAGYDGNPTELIEGVEPPKEAVVDKTRINELAEQAVGKSNLEKSWTRHAYVLGLPDYGDYEDKREFAFEALANLAKRGNADAIATIQELASNPGTPGHIQKKAESLWFDLDAGKYKK